MKRSFQMVISALVMLGFVGCNTESQQTSQQQSTFKQIFSIGPLIEGHQDLLLDGSRALSGMEAGPSEPFTQRNEYTTFQIESENVAVFMANLRSEVAEAIQTNGATIVGSSGNDLQADPIAYFSYDYREDPFYGVVNVWGLRGEESTFTIIAQITESKTQ